MMRLRPMGREEFTAFRESFVREWAADLARADELPEAEALAHAEARTLLSLPHGLATRHHFLFIIVNEEERVGTLWFSILGHRAFIDDLTIDPPFRRKGHGLRALALLEEKAAELSCTRIGLQTWRHNPGAVALYEKSGYQTTGVQMRKAIVKR